MLGGWSLGARAAAGVALHPDITGGWRPRALIGLAASYLEPAPTGSAPLDDIGLAAPLPTELVHGTEDEVVALEGSRHFALVLTAAGWPVHLTEPATDHAGIIGTAYDREWRRCVEDHGERARAGLAASVRALVAASLPEQHLGIRRVLALSPEDRLRGLTSAAAFFAGARRVG